MDQTKVCEHCGRTYSRSEIGRQNLSHWETRRYCGRACHHAAKAPQVDGDRVRCADCKEFKHRSEFFKNCRSKTGVQSYCKPCRNKRFPSRSMPFEYQKRANLKRYGITLEQYQQMHAEQNGLCAICGHPETATNPKGGKKSLAVDHCHITGRVRGLLCHNCNRGIGHLKESPQIMAAAVRYLTASWPTAS